MAKPDELQASADWFNSKGEPVAGHNAGERQFGPILAWPTIDPKRSGGSHTQSVAAAVEHDAAQ